MKEVELNQSPETIVILGAPGSGKDTQAGFLVDTLGYQVISTGELMRILAGHNEKIREMMKRGDLIPDPVVEDELISAFVFMPEGQPVILDGYPRNVAQAQKLETILAQNSRKLDRVILIDLDEKEAVKRLSGRKMCPSCHLVVSKEEKSEKCPKCGQTLIIREDDKPEAIKHRIEVFKKATAPMIEYFKKLGNLAIVDGKPTPEVVREEIRRVL